MADLVVQDGIGFKRRNPWGAVLLSFVTFGIYYLVWYYKVNNELRNLGEKVDPLVSVLAEVPELVVHLVVPDEVIDAERDE